MNESNQSLEEQEEAAERQRKVNAEKAVEQQEIETTNIVRNNSFKNLVNLESTPKHTKPRLSISRSQEEETAQPIITTFRSNNSSPYRQTFRKSHTCGSLFAKCNCNSFIEPTPVNSTLNRLNSISPSSAEVSMSASSLFSTKATSGVYSLSSGAASAQLSRDSEDASFEIPTTPSTRQSCCEFNTTSNKQNIARNIQRTSTVTVTITDSDAPELSAANSNKTQRKVKRLFQSYSHPDTDFIFTDENRHPLPEAQRESVIKSRGGRVEIKPPKRSSSPNISHAQLLDVAVHPDILVKISPNNLETSLSTARSIQQRRRFLQRTHEIDSNSSTSESDHSFDVPQEAFLGIPIPKRSPSPLPTSNSPTSTKHNNFEAAQKYFAESGILGPINNPCSNLIRKTSQILQDTNVIEQIRKTSVILRTAKKNSAHEQPVITNSGENPPSLALSSSYTESFTKNHNKMDALAAAAMYSGDSPAAQRGLRNYNTNLGCEITDERDALIKDLESEILTLKDVIKSRDNEIMKLRREIHKLKVRLL